MKSMEIPPTPINLEHVNKDIVSGDLLLDVLSVAMHGTKAK